MLPERRWYAAWHPERRDYAIIRAKSPEEFQEWRRRDWNLFPSPPIILDMTEATALLLAALALPDGGRKIRGRRPQPMDAVLIVTDDGPDLALRPANGPKLPGEVASIGADLRAVVGDIAGGAGYITAERNPALYFGRRLPFDGSRSRAVGTFTAGTQVTRVRIRTSNGSEQHWLSPIESWGAEGPIRWRAPNGSPQLWWREPHPHRPPRSEWPPLHAAEDATEPGQLVRVRQGVEARTEGV